MRAAGCSFGGTEGDSMAASRGWCLPRIPRSPCSAKAWGDRDECHGKWPWRGREIQQVSKDFSVAAEDSTYDGC